MSLGQAAASLGQADREESVVSRSPQLLVAGQTQQPELRIGNTPPTSHKTSAAPSDEHTFARAFELFDAGSLGNDSFHWQTALSTACASQLVQEDVRRIRSVVERDWKFADTQFIAANGTKCLLATNMKTVLISIGGRNDSLDWLKDFELIAEQMPYGTVHLGFQSGFRNIKRSVEKVLANQVGERELVLTGHGWGGALAIIAAAEWHHRYPIRAVYTFGQPSVGDRDFQNHAIEHFAAKLYRLVNQGDIVPEVPSGDFHVGKRYRLDADVEVEGTEVTDSRSLAPDQPLTIDQLGLFKAQLKAMHAQKQAAAAVNESAVNEATALRIKQHSISSYLQGIKRRLIRLMPKDSVGLRPFWLV